MAILAAGIAGGALAAGGAWAAGWGAAAILTAASVGFSVGTAIGSRIWGPEPPSSTGPRMDKLSIQSSSFGESIPIIYGTVRTAGNIIWSAGFTEHEHEESA